jgi:hypothetical protein
MAFLGIPFIQKNTADLEKIEGFFLVKSLENSKETTHKSSKNTSKLSTTPNPIKN